MARRGIGELEAEVLGQMWASGEAMTPSDVLERLDDDLAYTTVMTILRRLWEKGLVEREPRGRAYAYRPVLSEADLAVQRMHELLAQTADPLAALSRFAGSLSSRDAKALRAGLDRPGRRP